MKTLSQNKIKLVLFAYVLLMLFISSTLVKAKDNKSKSYKCKHVGISKIKNKKINVVKKESTIKKEVKIYPKFETHNFYAYDSITIYKKINK